MTIKIETSFSTGATSQHIMASLSQWLIDYLSIKMTKAFHDFQQTLPDEMITKITPNEVSVFVNAHGEVCALADFADVLFELIMKTFCEMEDKNNITGLYERLFDQMKSFEVIIKPHTIMAA